MPLPAQYKIPRKYAPFVMPFILSLFMTCIISGISTMHSIGINAAALHAWPSAWLLSWMIGFPTLLIVLPIVRRIVAAIVEN